jgi:hypothetical protein
VWRGVVRDEIDVDIPPISCEFTGVCTHTGLYDNGGKELLLITMTSPLTCASIADTLVVQPREFAAYLRSLGNASPNVLLETGRTPYDEP